MQWLSVKARNGVVWRSEIDEMIKRKKSEIADRSVIGSECMVSVALS